MINCGATYWLSVMVIVMIFWCLSWRRPCSEHFPFPSTLLLLLLRETRNVYEILGWCRHTAMNIQWRNHKFKCLISLAEKLGILHGDQTVFSFKTRVYSAADNTMPPIRATWLSPLSHNYDLFQSKAFLTSFFSSIPFLIASIYCVNPSACVTHGYFYVPCMFFFCESSRLPI